MKADLVCNDRTFSNKPYKVTMGVREILGDWVYRVGGRREE